MLKWKNGPKGDHIEEMQGRLHSLEGSRRKESCIFQRKKNHKMI